MRAGIVITSLIVGLTAFVPAKAADETAPPQANVMKLELPEAMTLPRGPSRCPCRPAGSPPGTCRAPAS